MTQLLHSVEPATGQHLWSGPVGDVDAEVEIARRAWPEWAAKPLTYRTEMMRRFANLIKSERDGLADLISRETGKPIWESRTEVESVIERVEASIRSCGERTPNRRTEGALGLRQALRHKPHGTLAVISPYNMPAALPAAHILPALIAGNSVVFKPSEYGTAVGQKLVELLYKVGLPESALRLLVGGPDIGKQLATHPLIDGLLFTGSTRTGLALNMMYAANPGKILALEMGGNNALVVWDTADLRTAATLVVQSAFLSAGQRCSNARRLIIKDSMADALITEVKMLANRIIVDHPHAEPAPYMGPMISNDAADDVTASFLDMMAKGGQIIRPMTRPDPERPFLTPGIIDMTRVAEPTDAEFFGPLLQVYRAESFEEAIELANASRYGLSATLIGGSPSHYDQFWANIRAGVINWNRPTNEIASNAPFGGIGLSGNHRPSAFYAADYCAYPVASAEIDTMRASIGIGLRTDERDVPKLILKGYN